MQYMLFLIHKIKHYIKKFFSVNNVSIPNTNITNTLYSELFLYTLLNNKAFKALTNTCTYVCHINNE